MIVQLLGDRFSSDSFMATVLLEGIGSPTLLCVVGSRIFFNLKEAAEHDVNIGTNWSSYSHSAIHFDGPQSAAEHPEYVTSAP